MWESALDGRRLRFHLAGINNQNFIMQDEETGTWWQQVNGLSLAYPVRQMAYHHVVNDMFGTTPVVVTY